MFAVLRAFPPPHLQASTETGFKMKAASSSCSFSSFACSILVKIYSVKGTIVNRCEARSMSLRSTDSCQICTKGQPPLRAIKLEPRRKNLQVGNAQRRKAQTQGAKQTWLQRAKQRRVEPTKIRKKGDCFIVKPGRAFAGLLERSI
jgi:hypothetical protein